MIFYKRSTLKKPQSLCCIEYSISLEIPYCTHQIVICFPETV